MVYRYVHVYPIKMVIFKEHGLENHIFKREHGQQNHRIGWWDNFHRKALNFFDGKNHGFRWRFPQETNQSIDQTIKFSASKHFRPVFRPFFFSQQVVFLKSCGWGGFHGRRASDFNGFAVTFTSGQIDDLGPGRKSIRTSKINGWFKMGPPR